MLPREITSPIQDVIAQPQPGYVRAHGRLDVLKLLGAFQQYFREHSEAWFDRFEYQEAGPQLLMQAFLQRIVNGGGRISREYGLDRRRTDLYLEWPLDQASRYNGPVQRVVIELKLLRKAPEATHAEGIEQTADYADKCGADETYLILFDRRADRTWEERIWQRTEVRAGRAITAWGMGGLVNRREAGQCHRNLRFGTKKSRTARPACEPRRPEHDLSGSFRHSIEPGIPYFIRCRRRSSRASSSKAAVVKVRAMDVKHKESLAHELSRDPSYPERGGTWRCGSSTRVFRCNGGKCILAVSPADRAGKIVRRNRERPLLLNSIRIGRGSS